MEWEAKGWTAFKEICERYDLKFYLAIWAEYCPVEEPQEILRFPFPFRYLDLLYGVKITKTYNYWNYLLRLLWFQSYVQNSFRKQPVGDVNLKQY